MKRLNQHGFAGFEVAVIVIVLAIVAVAGVKVWNARSDTTSTSTAQTTKSAANVSSAPAINTTSDLTKASATLDQNDPGSANSSDSAQLNSQLAGY